MVIVVAFSCLGNVWLHKLTLQDPTELRVDLGDFENEFRYAKYNTMTVGSEDEKFILKIGVYSGDAGSFIITIICFKYQNASEFIFLDMKLI